MNKIKTSTLIALIIICLLVIIFSILLVLYLKDNAQVREYYTEEKITIINKGNILASYTFDELVELTDIKTFTAVYKPSGKLPIEREYSGIELKELLKVLNIDYENSQGVVFKASDGMQKIYSISDVMQENNVFIANKVEGQPFNKGIVTNAYSTATEDGGPFVVIKANDNVSQNRVKMLVSIEVL